MDVKIDYNRDFTAIFMLLNDIMITARPGEDFRGDLWFFSGVGSRHLFSRLYSSCIDGPVTYPQ